jgi:catechol 2,3-dioxygenase-like lactoylglutathione lyase family enzyme
MLVNSPVHPILQSTDLAETRAFYHEKLGLRSWSPKSRAPKG